VVKKQEKIKEKTKEIKQVKINNFITDISNNIILARGIRNG
jgi:hypothetical protein